MSDLVKWSIVGVLALLGGGSHYMFSSLPTTQLTIAWVILGSALLGVMAITSQGKVFVNFAREAQIELKKVVWPTRQEAVQTTFIVLAVILVMGILLWVMDSVLLHVVGVITGQKG